MNRLLVSIIICNHQSYKTIQLKEAYISDRLFNSDSCVHKRAAYTFVWNKFEWEGVRLWHMTVILTHLSKYSNGNNTWKQHKHPFFDPSSSFDLGDLSEVDTISLKLISDCVTAKLMHIVGAKLTQTASFAQKVPYFLDVQKDNPPAIYNGFNSSLNWKCSFLPYHRTFCPKNQAVCLTWTFFKIHKGSSPLS